MLGSLCVVRVGWVGAPFFKVAWGGVDWGWGGGRLVGMGGMAG